MLTSCQIISYTHLLNKEAFKFLENPQVNMKAKHIQKDRFILVWDTTNRPDLKSEYEWFHAHLAFSSFIAAINIASLGIFSWGDGLGVGPIYGQYNPETNKAQLITLKQDHQQNVEEKKSLTDQDIKKTIILFLLLVKEEENFSRSEYLRGVIHLSINHFDINFHREAFSNFYRSFEYFVARKILKTNKLKNELKQMQEVLSMYGAEDDLVDDFKEIYKLRSSQIMHAQNEQLPITYDDARKIKAYADLLMHKFYRNEADKLRKKEK